MLPALVTALALAGTPPAAPPPELEEGVAALKAKNAALAAEKLQACVEKQPANVACHWELGWAFYLSGDWERVVAEWSEVKRLDPSHAEVDKRLEEARGQLALRRKLDEAAAQAPTVRPAVRPEVSIRLRAVGDMMLGTTFPEGYLPPDDGAKLLDDVKDWLADADLTFANFEGPLCDTDEPSDKCRGSKPGSCYAFKSPTRYAKYVVEAGIDVGSTANNHNGDFGEACRRSTEKTLDAAGIKWSGAPGTIASLERNGLKIGFVAFHTSNATNDVNDLATAVKLVKVAKAQHDLVIVSFHGGAEGAKATHVPHGKELFYGENRGDLRRFTHGVIDAGADLVIGHGPHVLRGMEIYKGHLVAYSLGNFATYGRFNLSGPTAVGCVLEVVLGGDGKFVSGKILPTKQIGEGVPVKDPDGTAIRYVRMLSEEDFPKTGVLVDAEGNIGPREDAQPGGTIVKAKGTAPGH